ncbi:MAG: carboxypeptidase regulatory-like domain-containing protein [Bacteroidetes bacterium]|nr:carboxypeptidase regulatory-like domain-containing protein [Bacteroidota bacterium]
MLSISARFVSCIAIVAAFSLIGCSHNNPTDPATPSKNSIKGEVEIMDEYGNPMEDLSGVTVAIYDETNRYTGMTNAKGEWILYNVPAGVYTLEATAPGCVGRYGGESDVYYNIMWVGAGGYHFGFLALSKPISASMISRGAIEIDTSIRFDPGDGGFHKPRYDTTLTTMLAFDTKCKGTTICSLAVGLSPIPACDSSIIQVRSLGASKYPRARVDITSVIADLKKKLGSTPTLVYFFVRPEFKMAARKHGPWVPQCLDPIVIPYQVN